VCVSSKGASSCDFLRLLADNKNYIMWLAGSQAGSEKKSVDFVDNGGFGGVVN
jgi:hypothetical protein